MFLIKFRKLLENLGLTRRYLGERLKTHAFAGQKMSHNDFSFREIQSMWIFCREIWDHGSENSTEFLRVSLFVTFY